MIRGTQRPVLKMDEPFQARIHNRFDVEVIDAKSGTVKQKAIGHNTICDQMWDRFAAKSTWFNYIQYGTGGGTPSASDKALFSYAGHKGANGTSVAINRKECVASLTRSITLSETEAVGVTITEVGIAYSTGSSTLVTHAMLKDVNGNPISIAKSDTDILNIHATVYAHWPREYASVTNPIRLIPDLYTYNNAPSYGIVRWLLGIVSSPPGAANLSSNMVLRQAMTPAYAVSSTSSFEASSRTATVTFNRIPVGKGNVRNGAHGVMVSHILTGSDGSLPVGPCLYFASDVFGGSDIIGESVGTGDGTTVDFATKFDLPTNAVVYVDGVLADATVDEVPLNSSCMQGYFEMITEEDGNAYPGCHFSTSYSNIYGDDYFFALPHGVYYNRFHSYGIKRIAGRYGNNIAVSVSNDLLTWTNLGTFNSNGTDIPEEYWYSKYWNFGYGDTSCWVTTAEAVSLTGKNIHFAEPPPQGSVITIDYHTPTIAKDENHVFDLTVTIQLGEYAEG